MSIGKSTHGFSRKQRIPKDGETGGWRLLLGSGLYRNWTMTLPELD